MTNFKIGDFVKYEDHEEIMIVLVTHIDGLFFNGTVVLNNAIMFNRVQLINFQYHPGETAEALIVRCFNKLNNPFTNF